MGKLIITEQNNRLLLSLFDEKKPQLFQTAALPEEEGLLGNIYIARVKDVVSGFRGAFLSISDKDGAYLSLAHNREVLCTNREITEDKPLRQGDEIVVQITGEALKTKQPTASSNLTLAGQYCVCSFFGHGIRLSHKVNKEDVDRLSQSIKEQNIPGRKQYQFTIRTNTAALEDLTPLFDEMKAFIHTFDRIKETYKYRSCYSCIYQTEAEIVRFVQDIPLKAYEEIVTDNLEVYTLLNSLSLMKPIRLYQDDFLSLSRLYSIDTHLQECLSKRVWLPCGGYLVIEPTEAMVVIDVNSGKTESRGKNPENFYLKVNLEAARETARQLRLRNYSGMIMVDFINMESKENNGKLLKALDSYLMEDKIRTRLVDMTALGIVEITRKKVNKPLSEWIL